EITERRQNEIELQEKNSEIERFTYMISHDLKSPLVTVKTFLGYLEQDLSKADAERIEKDMYYIRTAADKMGQLLEALLEISRIGRMSNTPVRVTFQELFEEARSMVAGGIAERGVEVRLNGEPVILCGDRPRLVEIWQNLLENAVKFMGDQPVPAIEAGVERCGEEMIFFVRDNGLGIDPLFHDKIFGLFEKLNQTMLGTGLGLALVKRIVELYRGRIWVESQGPGSGTCFRFTLPEAVKNDIV
ncbi:MAG: histidine kinase, partial [Deltaproteobacteria bacterium]|nr:histidine kinase [Deltaproteobacteria bacterium]